MSLKKLAVKFAVLMLLIFTMRSAPAQEDRGRIAGLVTDPTGAVVPHATVTLRSEDTGVTVTRSSDAAGAYIFELLNPGLYTVDVNAQGFKKFEVQHVRVQVADHVGVNAKLQLGEASETVTVTESGGAHLDTDDAVLGYTIEQRSVNELPLLYSNPFELQLLAPGVLSTTLNSATHTYEGGPESAVINGASQSGRTEFTLDGAPDTRNGGAVTTAYIPSRDFIGEFKLISSPYDASISHTSGASLDTSLKSGSSQFHGGAQVFEQFPEVNAPQFSQGTSTPPAAKYNRESVEVDGPILRRKLFFFAGYQKQYNKQAASTSTQTVPTAAEKLGDFSALLAAGKLTTSNYTCASNGKRLTTPQYNQYQLFNPFSTHADPNCPGLYLRDAIPGNIVTSIKPIDPIAKKFLSYYPDPTPTASATATGQNNFISTAANVDYAWDVSTRLDYTLNDRQKFFGHYIISDRRQPGKNLFFPGASGKTNILRNKAGVLDFVDTLSSTLVLDARYSLTRFTTSSSIDAKTTATDLGISANATAGAPAAALGFPYFSPSSFAELGNADPSFEYDTIHDGQINVTKVLNRHNLKFGAEWRLYQANQADLTNEKLFVSSSGSYAAGPSSALSSAFGQSLASIELGIAEGTNERLNAQTSNNTQYWGSFIQDDWKVNPKLTVNVGLRYEYGSPIKERNGKSITYFDFNTPNPISAQAKLNYAATSNSTEQGLVPVSSFAVNGGLHYVTPGEDNWNAQTLNFSPRFGFSYNPIPKLVVRGGFGLFFQHYAEYVQYGNPLGFTQQTNTIVSTDNGVTYTGASLANPFPSGLIQPTGSTTGMLQSVGVGISQFYQQKPKTPYNERFSFGLQYELPGSIVLEANYVGNLGRHLTITRDFNAVPDSRLAAGITRTAQMTAVNGQLSSTGPNPFSGINVTGCTLCTQITISGSQLMKPFPEFTGLSGRDNSGMSNYNALQVSAQKRFSHGYNISVSYQWSRTLDAISFLNAGDAQPWYGVSNSDYPQELSTAAIYELPFGHGKPFFSTLPKWADEAVRGFQVQGTYRISSGQPLTFSNAGSALRPGLSYKDINGPSLHDYRQWFNTHAFYNSVEDGSNYTNEALVGNLRVMPLRFNNVRQDYQNLLNVGALKKFQVYRERVNMDVRAEAINALNHQVYSNPNTDPSNASFGKIGSAGNQARILQFAVEAHF